MKIVVFDLDETLGYFVEFGVFCDCLNKYLKISNNYEIQQEDFNQILDLYPEFLRPNIINILNYLKSKKMSKCCQKMMIYTNNQGPKQWAISLISYFETKIKYNLFDQIIAAFKVNGNQIEMSRTSHDKSHNDFIKCTKLPVNAEICFLDDNFYPEMSNKNIYYIHLKPYIHQLNFNEMIKRLSESVVGSKIIQDKVVFQKQMNNDFKNYKYDYLGKSKEDYEIDEILGKQIMNHLRIFFNKSKTKRNNRTRQNKTAKNKH
jgi:hypothetical protein